MSHLSRVVSFAIVLVSAAAVAFAIGFAVRVAAVAVWYQRWPRWRDSIDGLPWFVIGWLCVLPLLLLVQEGVWTSWPGRKGRFLVSAACAVVGVLSTFLLLFMFGARRWSEDVAWILFQGAVCGIAFPLVHSLLDRDSTE